MEKDTSDKKTKQQISAHLLMEEFVKREANTIALALEEFVVIKGEITYESLQRNIGVVSQTFAGLALQLIDHNSGLDYGDINSLTLPVGAREMNSTLEDLSKLSMSLRSLFFLILKKYEDDPAIVMAHDANWTYDTQM